MPKPIVLHIGEPIKYNHEFYESDFLSRFQVVRNEDLNRQSFTKALEDKKYAHKRPYENLLFSYFYAYSVPAMLTYTQIWQLLSHLPPTLPNRWRNGPMGLRTDTSPSTLLSDIRLRRSRLQLGRRGLARPTQDMVRKRSRRVR